jgi:hypothetical protein
MKRIFSLATAALLVSGTSAYAAPEAVVNAVASCCAAVAACCGASMPCCP